MTVFDATAPAIDLKLNAGSISERFRFGSRIEADAAADLLRGAGCSIIWIVWAEGLQRFVTVPED